MARPLGLLCRLPGDRSGSCGLSLVPRASLAQNTAPTVQGWVLYFLLQFAVRAEDDSRWPLHLGCTHPHHISAPVGPVGGCRVIHVSCLLQGYT